MTLSDPLRLVGVVLHQKYTVESVVRVEAGNIVYRATHVPTSRSFGVRVLTGLTDLDEPRRRTLYDALVRDHAHLAEIATIAPAAHPIRDVGTLDTPHGAWVPFVVLTWPHGLTFEQALSTHHGESFPDSFEGVTALLEPIAVALALAHEHAVVHGSVTADRILLREDGDRAHATLLDFGVARALRAVEGASPTIADDVRGLACLMSRSLARACGADARPAAGLTPRTRGVVVDDELEAAFTRALSPESFPTVGEFWGAVRRALHLAPLRSMEATLPPEVPSSIGSSRSLRPIARSTPPPPPTNAKAVARTRALYAVGLLALVALGIVTTHRTNVPRPATPAPSCDGSTVTIAASTYRAGAEGDADDPAREVTLGAACVDREAVTTRAYKACSDRGECKRASRTNEWEGIDPSEHDALDPNCRMQDPDGTAALPINCITWEMAAAYCAERGSRLPTEAEWEIASRATGASIAEWVSDWSAPIAANGPQVDPRGPAGGEERVVRGPHASGASSARFGARPTTRSHAIGFRCVRSP